MNFTEYVQSFSVSFLIWSLLRVRWYGKINLLTAGVALLCSGAVLVIGSRTLLSVILGAINLGLLLAWVNVLQNEITARKVTHSARFDKTLKDIQREIIKTQIFICNGDMDKVAHAMHLTREQLRVKMSELHLLDLDESGNIV